jgi:hypothetical protein
MNNDYREIVYKKAIERFGKVHQITKAVEEMSELQKELCKVQIGEMEWMNVIEEIADVEIMLEQLRLIFNSDRDIERVKGIKIERLERKMLEC